MATYYLGPDQSGRYPRITIEQQVLNPAGLVEVQRQLAASLPGFMPNRPDDFHITDLHLGRMNELFAEVLGAAGKGSLATFISLMQTVVGVGDYLVPESHPAGVTHLTAFDTGRTATLVASVGMEPWWYQRRDQELMPVLEQCLRECGIPDPDAFMASSINLAHGRSKGFHPHATIGRVPAGTPVEAALAVPVGNLRLELAPSAVRGGVLVG